MVGGFIGVKNYLLPKVIAESVSGDKPLPAFIPKKVEKTVEVVKQNVDQNMDQLPIIMNELNLDFNDLLYIIDNVNPDQVIKAQKEMGDTEISSTNQAFDIVKRNISIEGYDLEIFRPLFNEKMTVPRINKLVQIAEKNQLQTNMSIPMARNTAKQILLKHKDRIESELARINRN